MKKILLIFGITVCLYTEAQITLEHTYTPSTGVRSDFSLIHLSGAGYKYLYPVTNTANSVTVSLYNLNHSVYKTFNTPVGKSQSPYVMYVSDSLFDTNSSTLEYIFIDGDSALTYRNVSIYDETGKKMLFVDSSAVDDLSFTPTGYKLIIATYNKGLELVYSLPGALPCDECTSNHTLSGIKPISGNNYLMNAYPNPSSGMVTIRYQLPDGVNKGSIVFYDLQGREIKSFVVDKSFDSLNLTTSDIASGTYFYVLKTENGNIGTKKMVVMK